MSSSKRDRQRANRESRLAAAEAETRRAAWRNRAVMYGVLAAVIVVAIVGFAVLRSDGDSSTSSDAPETSLDPPAEDASETEAGSGDFVYGSGSCPAPDGSSERVIDFAEPQPLCIDPAKSYSAVFDTSEGEIAFELDGSAVPGTVNNFVSLARWGYYDETLLFRTDPSIDIIQGGSPHTNDPGDPGPGYTIRDEPAFDVDATTGAVIGPYRYEPGQIVMARSFGENSASAQFFFTTGADTALLDGQGSYVVFGTTDDAGLEVMQSIMDLHVDDGSLGGAPSRDVTVFSVTIQER